MPLPVKSVCATGCSIQSRPVFSRMRRDEGTLTRAARLGMRNLKRPDAGLGMSRMILARNVFIP